MKKITYLLITLLGIALFYQGCKRDILIGENTNQSKTAKASGTKISTLSYPELKKNRSAEEAILEKVLSKLSSFDMDKDSLRVLNTDGKNTYIFRVKPKNDSDTTFQNISITDSTAILYTYYPDKLWRYYHSLGYSIRLKGKAKLQYLLGKPETQGTQKRSADPGECISVVTVTLEAYPCKGGTNEKGNFDNHMPGEAGCDHAGTDDAAGYTLTTNVTKTCTGIIETGEGFGNGGFSGFDGFGLDGAGNSGDPTIDGKKTDSAASKGNPSETSKPIVTTAPFPFWRHNTDPIKGINGETIQLDYSANYRRNMDSLLLYNFEQPQKTNNFLKWSYDFFGKRQEVIWENFANGFTIDGKLDMELFEELYPNKTVLQDYVTINVDLAEFNQYIKSSRFNVSTTPWKAPLANFTKKLIDLSKNLSVKSKRKIQTLINQPAIYLYLEEYKALHNYSLESQDFAKWAAEFLKEHPEMTMEEFENWFMGESEGQDGEYIGNIDASLSTIVYQKRAMPTYSQFVSVFPKLDFPNHPGYFKQMPASQVYPLVGGNLENLYKTTGGDSGPYRNACTVRWSMGMNGAGFLIPNNLLSRKGSDVNGSAQYYYLQAVTAGDFMLKTFGSPNHKLEGSDANDPKKISAFLKGKTGIYVIINNDSKAAGYTGHVDLIQNGYIPGGANANNVPSGIKSIRVWEFTP